MDEMGQDRRKNNPQKIMQACSLLMVLLVSCSCASKSYPDSGDLKPSLNGKQKAAGPLKMEHIESGGYYSCGIMTDGTVRCWGYDHPGSIWQTGASKQGEPVQIQGLKNVVQLAMDLNHACALLKTGRVRCWGNNDYGQLGHADTPKVPQLVDVPNVLDAVHIAVSQEHSCAVLKDTTVMCWGDNSSCKVNYEDPMYEHVPPKVVPNVKGAVQVSAGLFKTCVILKDGSMQCWGKHFEAPDEKKPASSLLGGSPSILPPTTLAGISGAKAFVDTRIGSCVELNDGKIKCWGNYHGLIENGLAGLSDVVQITIFGHACALLKTGKVACWGDNSCGELGDGTTHAQFAPVTVKDLDNAKQVIAGIDHSCALKNDGTVVCWGSNDYNQLGDPGMARVVPRPVMKELLAKPMKGLKDIVRIDSGILHHCALDQQGYVFCWGRNESGEVGVPASEKYEMPVPVKKLKDAAELSLGRAHSCARLTNGRMYCWGEFLLCRGECSEDKGSIIAMGHKPKMIGGKKLGAIHISSNEDTVCAVTHKDIRCWGEYGAYALKDIEVIGEAQGTVQFLHSFEFECRVKEDGTMECSGGPLPLRQGYEAFASAKLKNVAQLSYLWAHVCARLDDNTVWCWGENTYGQLGDGTHLMPPEPVRVINLLDATFVSAGYDHTCAALVDGSVMCWGLNDRGQLGDGTLNSWKKPVKVVGVSDAAGVSAGDDSCAWLHDGTVMCWGEPFE